MLLSKLLSSSFLIGFITIIEKADAFQKRYQDLWDNFDPKTDFENEAFMYAVHDFVKDKTDEETYVVDQDLPLEVQPIKMTDELYREVFV